MTRTRRHHTSPLGATIVLLFLMTTGFLTLGCGNEKPMNVLLVTIDTTRADHIGCYGQDQILTPAIDGLAAEGVLFEKAYSAIPLTTPSHSTIMTGKYPFAHGVRDNGQFVLPEQQETLAEILKAEGYATGAAIGAFPLTRLFGIDQGFDYYDDKVARVENTLVGERSLPKQGLFFDERKAGRVNEALIPWLEANGDEPFFAWAHYFDPHQPFESPPPYDQIYAHDGYLGEIAYADESFGALLDTLRNLGVYDRTLIVIASDHGEGRDQHNELTHSLLLYDTTLHVPFVMKVPGGSVGQRIDAPVATADIMPTVLDYLGLPSREDVQGRSLRPLIEGAPATDPPPIYAETLAPRLGYHWGELRALIQGDLKYIHGPRPELFDVRTDPAELDDLVHQRPKTAETMRTDLEEWLTVNAVTGVDAAVEVDDATRRQLMALGYLSGTGDDASEIQEVLRSDGTPPQDRVGDISDFSHAKNLLLERKSLPAREVFQGLVDKNPENPVYRELLAAAMTQLGQLDAALEVLQETADQGKIGSGLLLQIGSVYFFRGEYELAKETMERSLALEDDAVGRYLLANVFSVQGNRTAEIDELRKALEIDPTYAQARVDLAIRYAQGGDRESAEAEFLRAIDDEPYFAKAFFNYGAFLAEDGFLADSASSLGRSIELNPTYWRAYVALVQVHLAKGDRESAEQIVKTLESRAPGSSHVDQAKRLVEEGS